MAERHVFSIAKPWLIFKPPTDAYALAHFLMAQFVRAFGTIHGAKVFASLQAALVMGVFFIAAQRLGIKRPLLWTVLFAVASPLFLIRLLFERPFVLSIAILLAAFLLIREKKYVWLGALSFFYILYYNLAPLIIILALVNMAVDFQRKEPISLRPLIAALAGLTLGILLHPERSNYIWHMAVHFFWVLGLKIAGVDLNSGGEIETQTIVTTASHNILLILLVSGALGGWLYLREEKKLERDHVFLAAIVAPWFFLLFAIPRAVEYAAPFGCLLAGTVFAKLNQLGVWDSAERLIERLVPWRLAAAFMAVPLLLLNSITIATGGFKMHRNVSSRAVADFRSANEYLVARTPAHSVIFHTEWDIFPLMFYFNTHNRYITAFDPAFLYVWNKEMFWIHYNIAYGGVYCNHEPPCRSLQPDTNAHAIALAIQNVFESESIVVENKPGEFKKLLDAYPQYFTKKHENQTLAVYHAP